MTEVAFHFNAPEKLAYASRLLRKAYLKGARLVVLSEPRQASALDHLLWTVGEIEFVPHCLDSAPPALAARSPIFITRGEAPVGFDATVLVNLTDNVPVNYHRFERVIEVVTPVESDRQRARERWRQYKLAGLEPQRHDLKLAG